MSTASKIGRVTFIRKGSVFMTLLQSVSGDLFQEYDGEPSAPTNHFPDFTATAPILDLIVTSSSAAEGEVTPNSVDWYFNDTLLTFTNGVSTNIFNGETGHFKRLDASSSRSRYGLQIVKNLVVATGAAACNIRAEASVSVGIASEVVQYTYSIPITKGVGKSAKITISAGNENGFTFKEKGQTVILVARFYQGSDIEVTSGVTYQWFQSNGADWGSSFSTAKSVTITDTMIQTDGIFMVKVFQNGTLVGHDTQVVLDMSDPFDILTNPVHYTGGVSDNLGEIIMGSNELVRYKPILVRRGSTTEYGTKPSSWSWIARDSVGNPLGNGTFASGGTFDITYEMCEQAGGDVDWLITAGDIE